MHDLSVYGILPWWLWLVVVRYGGERTSLYRELTLKNDLTLLQWFCRTSRLSHVASLYKYCRIQEMNKKTDKQLIICTIFESPKVSSIYYPVNTSILILLTIWFLEVLSELSNHCLLSSLHLENISKFFHARLWWSVFKGLPSLEAFSNKFFHIPYNQ